MQPFTDVSISLPVLEPPFPVRFIILPVALIFPVLPKLDAIAVALRAFELTMVQGAIRHLLVRAYLQLPIKLDQMSSRQNSLVINCNVVFVVFNACDGRAGTIIIRGRA